MAIWITLALIAASTLAQLLLKPKVGAPKPKDLGRPTADEGKPIPLVYGIAALTPNLHAFGRVTKGQDVQQGYPATFYYAKFAGLLCQGPISRLLDVQFDGKSLALWPSTGRSATPQWKQGAASGTDEAGIYPDQGTGTQQVLSLSLINGVSRDAAGTPLGFYCEALDLFGREREGGGVAGAIKLHWGMPEEAEADRLLMELLEADGVPKASTLPQQCWIQFGLADDDTSVVDRIPGHHFYLGANTGQVPGLTVILQHLPTGLLDLDADPDTGPAAYNAAGKTLEERFEAAQIGPDANPAEVLYDLCTSPVRGLGISADLLDVAALLQVAKTCRAEQLGLSLQVADDSDPLDLIDDVLRHIRGVRYTDPATGTLRFDLVRPAADLASVLHLTPANTRDRRFSPGVVAQSYNEVRVTYRKFTLSTGDESRILGEELTPLWAPGGAGLSYLTTRYKHISDVTLYATDGEGTTITVDPSGYRVVSAENGVILLFGGGAQDDDRITADYTTTGDPWMGYTQGITAPAQDLANVLMTGSVRAQTVDYPMFTREVTAATQAAYLLRAAATPGTWECLVNGAGYDLRPGSVVVLDWPEYGLSGYVGRVAGEVDFGTLTDDWVRVRGMEDLWAAAPVAIPLPADGGGSATPPAGTQAAPAIAIGYVADSAIRVAFFPADPAFLIEWQRADDTAGTGAVTISATVPGTTAYGDDPQTVGTSKAYRARLVPTTAQAIAGWTAGEWTDWMLMTAQAGTPTDTPTCEPTSVTYSRSEDATTGTLTLTLTDPQARLQDVAFRTQAGTGALTDWVLDSVAPYTATVALVSGYPSTIEYRVRYLACDGTVGELTQTVTYPLATSTNSLVEAGEFVYEPDGSDTDYLFE